MAFYNSHTWFCLFLSCTFVWRVVWSLVGAYTCNVQQFFLIVSCPFNLLSPSLPWWWCWWWWRCCQQQRCSENRPNQKHPKIKLDGATGATLWVSQEGSPAGDDVLFSAASDSQGNLVAAGYTQGGFDGATSGGGYDGVVVKFDRDGMVLWSRQSGGVGDEGYRAVRVVVCVCCFFF